MGSKTDEGNHLCETTLWPGASVMLNRMWCFRLCIKQITFAQSWVGHSCYFQRFWASLVSSVTASYSPLCRPDTHGTDPPQMATGGMYRRRERSTTHCKGGKREKKHQPLRKNSLLELTSFSFLSGAGVCFLILFPVYATHF